MTTIYRLNTIEKRIRTAVKNRSDNRFAADFDAVIAAYDYWLKHDMLVTDNMARIFEYLYLNPRNFAVSLVHACIDLGLNDSTLRRYRRQFVEMFTICLNAGNKYRNSPYDIISVRK